jgi:hypothetical protein
VAAKKHKFKVWVDGVPYDMVFKEKTYGAHGSADENEIEVNVCFTPPSQAVTAWHEIFHRVFEQHKLKMKMKTEQSVVDLAAEALVQVMMDNPKFLRFFLRCLGYDAKRLAGLMKKDGKGHSWWEVSKR